MEVDPVEQGAEIRFCYLVTRACAHTCPGRTPVLAYGAGGYRVFECTHKIRMGRNTQSNVYFVLFYEEKSILRAFLNNFLYH